MSATFEPLEALPPARMKLTAALLAQGWERADIEEALDDYAHELAEEIREEHDAMREEMSDPRDGTTEDELNGMIYAADTIDPYPVGSDEEPTA